MQRGAISSQLQRLTIWLFHTFDPHDRLKTPSHVRRPVGMSLKKSMGDLQFLVVCFSKTRFFRSGKSH